jgi:ABC-type transport system involved in multi-copper enzyme maturation permease subunit
MKWLIWKEYRLNRLILIVGAVLLVAPHAVALVLALRGVGPVTEGGLSRLQMNLLLSAIWSLVLSQVTLALLGGNAIACERADRSAEFLAYLPVARTRILAAKIVLALVTVALIWIPNLLILRWTFGGLPEQGDEVYATGWIVLGTVAITGLAFYCIAWLLSSVLESPTFSICGGLVTPYLVMMVLALLGWWFGYIEEPIGLWYWGTYRGTCLVLAPACFAAGTWYYLRRVEP